MINLDVVLSTIEGFTFGAVPVFVAFILSWFIFKGKSFPHRRKKTRLFITYIIANTCYAIIITLGKYNDINWLTWNSKINDFPLIMSAVLPFLVSSASILIMKRFAMSRLSPRELKMKQEMEFIVDAEQQLRNAPTLAKSLIFMEKINDAIRLDYNMATLCIIKMCNIDLERDPVMSSIANMAKIRLDSELENDG